MKRTLALRAGESTLHLSTDEAGWCHVRLVRGTVSVSLGADVQDIVVARLAPGFEDPFDVPSTRSIDGWPAGWLLSLFEDHCTVYAADLGGERRLYFQDANANLIGTTTLSLEDRTRCLAQLTAYGRAR